MEHSFKKTAVHSKKPPSSWDESYSHVLPPNFPVPFRVTGSSAVINRPSINAGSRRSFTAALQLHRSKADPPRPFSETRQDRFPAAPALCSRHVIFVLISSSDLPIISYILIKRTAVCQAVRRSICFNLIPQPAKGAFHPFAAEPDQCHPDEMDGILRYVWPLTRTPSMHHAPQ